MYLDPLFPNRRERTQPIFWLTFSYVINTPSLFEEGSSRKILYGQPSSSSGLMMASLRTSSGGAVAIQTIRDATSAGGNALVTGGSSGPDATRWVDDHAPQWVAIPPG